MKPYQVLLTVIVVVLINNILLLGYLSNDVESQADIGDETGERLVRTKPSADDGAVSDRSSGSGSGYDPQIKRQQSRGLETEVSEAIRLYLRSDEFKHELTSYQTEFSSNYGEMQTRLTAMSVAELYSIAVDSSNTSEQEYAQALLIQNGIGELDSAQLKNLYLADDVSAWAKESVLLRLLEENDADAIGWAKQRLSDGAVGQYQDPELYAAVYDADPEFIKQHISNLNLDKPDQSAAALSFIMQDKELTRSFYHENFDKLLDVKNGGIYQYLYYPAEIELSNRQQGRLVELFDSNSRRQREFAINQAHNINDVSVLRDAYSRLAKKTDKFKFLQTLSNEGSNTEVASLVRELAAEPDSANIE